MTIVSSLIKALPAKINAFIIPECAYAVLFVGKPPFGSVNDGFIGSGMFLEIGPDKN